MFTRKGRSGGQPLPYTLDNYQAETTEIRTISELDELASMCGYEESISPNKKNELTIKEELAHYIYSINESENSFSEYWKQKQKIIPLLSSQVRKYCAIPASSVASESSFSIANYIQRKERSSLSSRNSRYSIILKQMSKVKIN